MKEQLEMPTLQRKRRTKNSGSRNKHRVYTFIMRYYQRERRGPTLQEIADQCNLSSAHHARHYVQQLQIDGKVTASRYQNRSIRPT